jgi:paraquat-inducible protein B
VDFTQDARDLLKDDTRFWIVRPQIGAAGISGIETLLSGVYIALDPGSTGAAQTHYRAMVDAPMVTRGSAGTRFLLKAADIGSLYVGAPIYFHHLKTGRLISYQMNPDRSAHPESLIRGRRAAPVQKRATQPAAGASTGPSSGSE